MEIIILCQAVLRNDISGAPIETDIINEFMIFIAKEESVLPILLIFIGDFLFNFT